MQNLGPAISKYGIEQNGLTRVKCAHWNLSPAVLYQHALQRGEANLTSQGVLVAHTGLHTGRSPHDKFVVKEPSSQDKIWWGDVNRPYKSATFANLHQKMLTYATDKDLYVFDGYAGADPDHRLRVRIITQYAWHSLFARNMFIRESDPKTLQNFQPEFTVIDFPGYQATPHIDETNSPTFVLMDFSKRLVLIGGTQYAGEIKKSIFTAMNYYLPKKGIMPMHCSANYGTDKEDVALFFGLSGTGKTTLSADASRTLIGDDEHGWTEDGVFNFEGGCYAKVIRLSAENEPEIYATTSTFGTILENVALDQTTHEIDLDSSWYTQNSRSSYPITQIPNADLGGRGGTPKNIIFLTADAFGVLPPISQLTPEQVAYYFLNGYTAKVAGTERGVTEPIATFSACFGAPFMPLHPKVYADLLVDKLEKNGTKAWLVNTGWTGGPYGTGSRMMLPYTRLMVNAAITGQLDQTPTTADPIFNLNIPHTVAGVPSEILTPRNTWADPAAYDAQAQKLANMFTQNYKQFL